jgi:predicted O-methyltransferase YrrM
MHRTPPAVTAEGGVPRARIGYMADQIWTAVDGYFADRLHSDDPVLDAALRASDDAGLPAIAVSPALGALLNIWAATIGARRILEVGTLGGYSTIWLARALPEDGRLVTCELQPKHAEVAAANIARAGLAERVQIRVGPALESLEALARERPEPFDMVFIDADKPNNAGYFEAALALSRPGTLIIVDNVVRRGEILDQESTDPNVLGVHRLAELVAAEPRVRATALQTVGSKGHDGFLAARVL